MRGTGGALTFTPPVNFHTNSSKQIPRYRCAEAIGDVCRRGICGILDSCMGIGARKGLLLTWSLIACSRFKIPCHCAQSSCRRNGRVPE